MPWLESGSVLHVKLACLFPALHRNIPAHNDYSASTLMEEQHWSKIGWEGAQCKGGSVVGPVLASQPEPQAVSNQLPLCCNQE